MATAGAISGVGLGRVVGWLGIARWGSCNVEIANMPCDMHRRPYRRHRVACQ